MLYLGLDRRYDHLLHHNFVFSNNPEEEFEAIYRRGEPAPDPTCYVCAPARTEPGVAPPGGDALYVLVHTPYLRPHHDWDRLFPAYRKTILEKLSGTAGLTDIADRIRVERWLTPADIHERYGVLNGAIYGIASHGRWLGAFKPSNRSPDVKGLYLAGGAAHPGPGMPMVLMSGWIAADALDRDGVSARTARGKRQLGCRRPSSSRQRRSKIELLLAGTGARSEFTPPVVIAPFAAARSFLHTTCEAILPRARLPCGPALKEWQTGSGAGRPADRRAQSPLLVGPAGRPRADRVVSGPCPLLRPWTRTRSSAIESSSVLGVFGVEPKTMRGAREFLRTSRSILARPRTALWITAQGRFADARERPPAHSTRSGSSRTSPGTRRSFCLWLWSIPSGKSAVPKRWPGSVRPSSSNGAPTEPLKSGVAALKRP